jgi:acyl-coenzyme A thioesterase PaaI-like protein
MPESWRTRITRWVFNFFPAWRGTGARMTYIASDWREVRVRVPLSWRTRNYVGTIFGGSLYAAADPWYMIMLIRNLGPAYTVWDKAASIRFKKPGRSALLARFVLEQAELDEIRRLLETEPFIDRVYAIELVDAAGTVHATVEKTIYIRKSGSGLAL